MNNQPARQDRQPATPQWARAVGTVVGVEQKRSAPTGIWAVLTGFLTPDGRTVVFTSALASPDSDVELGRSVAVRYRPEDPEQAQVDTSRAGVAQATQGIPGGLATGGRRRCVLAGGASRSMAGAAGRDSISGLALRAVILRFRPITSETDHWSP